MDLNFLNNCLIKCNFYVFTNQIFISSLKYWNHTILIKKWKSVIQKEIKGIYRTFIYLQKLIKHNPNNLYSDCIGMLIKIF